VPAVLAVFSILLPFLLLLSRRYKSSARGLAAVAVMLMLGQGLYTAWLILPSAGRFSPTGGLLALALLVAGGAVFADRFRAAARRLGRPAP
jgi:peptidoglycan/LPS O-acetylase OafA/YrhL